MNIQRKNSAHHFLMQSEREQTLVNVFALSYSSISLMVSIDYLYLNGNSMYGVHFSSLFRFYLLPARASEQGNVIGSVRLYIYIYIYNYIYMCVYKKNL